MAVRYFSRPSSVFVDYDDSGSLMMTADTVIEEDCAVIDTGLVDEHGGRIYREEVRAPIGFDLRKRDA